MVDKMAIPTYNTFTVENITQTSAIRKCKFYGKQIYDSGKSSPQRL